MLLQDAVREVYKKNWTLIANFSFILHPTPEFGNLINWGSIEKTNTDLNIACISIETPEYTNQSIEDYSGNMWRYNNGRDELFRFTMTFRDFNQFELYRKFVNAYNLSKDNYFDKVVFNCQVFADPDNGTPKSTLLFGTQSALIEGVSQLSLNNSTKNQIAEFTVRFKCNSPLHASVSNENSGSSVSGGLSHLKFF